MAEQARESGRDRLSRSLRALRKKADLSQRQAATRTGISQSKITRAESGLFILSPDETATYARALDATRQEREALVTLAWQVQAGSVDRRIIMQKGAGNFQRRLRDIEKQSALVRSFHPAVVLGILQTPDYMRAILTAGEPNPAAEETAQVRLQRQAELAADEERQWVLIQSEGSLRWQAARPGLMVAQLEHIIEVSYRPNVRVGVVDWRTPADVFPLHGFHVYDHRTVVVGTETATGIITDPDDVAYYDSLFGHLEHLARFDDEGRDTLTRIRDEYLQLPR